MVISALLIGKLSESARISLTSILKQFKAICMCVDSIALNDISIFLKQFDPIGEFEICFHRVTEEQLNNVELTVLDGHAEFGEVNFTKLTIFKWYLLLEILRNHNSIKYIIFSDLDVYWRTNEISFDFVNSVLVLAQNDSYVETNSIHFCTGIMVWKNCSESQRMLESLFERQLMYLREGNLIPDEPVFNEIAKQESSANLVNFLPKSKYLIGHAFYSLPFISRNFVAFHANYVIGDLRKSRRLLAIKNLTNCNPVFFWQYTIEVLIRIVEKYISKY